MQGRTLYKNKLQERKKKIINNKDYTVTDVSDSL
jgi:hypothetical protein